jgi:hypothetical protein
MDVREELNDDGGEMDERAQPQHSGADLEGGVVDGKERRSEGGWVKGVPRTGLETPGLRKLKLSKDFAQAVYCRPSYILIFIPLLFRISSYVQATLDACLLSETAVTEYQPIILPSHFKNVNAATTIASTPVAIVG